MRRFIAGGVVTTAIVLGTAVTSGAVPTKGETFSATCGDASVTVQNSPGFGNKAWGSDGTTYHLKSVELRIYRGQFTTEPANEVPLVEFSQGFGNRNGQGEAMACLVISHNLDHNATAFEYITVTSKR